jgi:hypothetical protein
MIDHILNLNYFICCMTYNTVWTMYTADHLVDRQWSSDNDLRNNSLGASYYGDKR